MIAITGGSGLIGRALVRRLSASGADFTLLTASIMENGGWLEHLLRQKIEPSALIHLAAAVPSPPKKPDTQSLAGVTLMLDREALTISNWFGCPVVYASGCSLYSKLSRRLGATEESPLQDISDMRSPYLSAKLMGESLFLATGRATIFRISTPIGLGLSDRSALGILIANAREEKRVRYFGLGTREQNYVDATDIARGIEMAIRNNPFEVVNIAAKESVTMKSLVELISTLEPGVEISQPSKIDPKEGEMARIVIKKAKARLGWEPLVPLKESVQKLLGRNSDF